MKPLLFLLLLPLFSFSQKSTYYSAEALAHLSKDMDNNGYGLSASGNMGISERLYGGLSVTAFRMNPFLKNISVPVGVKLTLFPFQEEDRITPFGVAEAGKIFYKAEEQVQNQRDVMQGKYNFSAAIGVRFPSQRNLHPYLQMGFTALYYQHNFYSTENIVVSKQDFNLKRLTVKAGLMLPRLRN